MGSVNPCVAKETTLPSRPLRPARGFSDGDRSLARRQDVKVGDAPIPSLDRYGDKIITAQQAAGKVRPGQRVFIGTACGTPRTLVGALEAMRDPPADVELFHFLTTNAVPHDSEGRCTTQFRHRTLFVDSDIRAAVRQGLAEYVPISAARVARLMDIGRIPIDVALIQVSPPDAFGYVSLGISVDIAHAAVYRAKMVIAEVNPNMPWTMGDSTLHVGQIHYLVPVTAPVGEYVHVPVENEVVQRIGRYIAGIIEDGSTLQVGLGRIPNEALKYLDDRRDLGIHSDVITESIVPLLEKGVLTGEKKTQHRNRIVASFALGTRRFYDLIDRNPLFDFQPMNAVCDPGTIASQHKMVSVTQAFAVDLTGQVCSDQFEGQFYSGLAAQGEFHRGASRSPGGKPIICLMSTTDDEATSRIRPLLLEGEGVSVARSDVHYVITEYGMAYLFGKSIRERAVALIDIAHPKFRQALFDEARRLGYVPADQTLSNMREYHVEHEESVVLRNGKAVMIRPARASDAESIRALFHQLSSEDVYTRFFREVKGLSNKDVQRLCNLDYENEVAFVAVTGPREQEMVVAQACYFVNPSTNFAETAFMVSPDWQGSGLGKALQRRLADHARARGLRGLIAEILVKNKKMVALARSSGDNITVERDEDVVHVTTTF
jgi:acyl-CoA hydrolase/L-amino acid N-acyltransferase YncA